MKQFTSLDFSKKSMPVDYIILPDVEADILVRSPNKRSMHFHHMKTDIDAKEVVLTFSTAKSQHSSVFNTIYILDSHNHLKLFDALRECYGHGSQGNSHGGNPFINRLYSGFTMAKLNAWLADIHKNEAGNVRVQQLRAKLGELLGPGYKIPERFQAVYFPLPKNSIRVIDPGVIRASTRQFPGDAVRVSCHFRLCHALRLLPTSAFLPLAFSHSQAARNFEMSKMGDKTKPVWPLRVGHISATHISTTHISTTPAHPISKNPNIQNSNESQIVESENVEIPNTETQKMSGIMCLDVQHLKDDISDHVEQWIDYIALITEEHEYRNRAQWQSKHFPDGHGRSYYGHFLYSNLACWKLVEPEISHLLPSNYIVSTCDIAIQQLSA